MSRPKPGVQERILLHLSDYSDYSNSVEVPFALSQMGIANAVAIARSNVPRAISGLKDQGLLIERQAHVHGVTRKRKSYFLTETGNSAAEETWTKLKEYPIRCIMGEGESVSTTLGSIQDLLPFQMRPVDVIRYMDGNGVLDVRLLSAELVERDLSKHVEKQLMTSLSDLPRIRHFFGRTHEMDNVMNLLDARSTTLLIPGIAGIGKTTMAAKLIENYMHRRNLLYHRCQEKDSSRSFFESIADWMASMGESIFADYIAATPMPNPAEAAEILFDGLEKASSLIVIDDYHKVSDEILHKTIQSLALSLIDSEGDIGLVLFSRSFRPVVPLKNAEGKIASLVLPLEGLDQDAAKKLLDKMEGIENEQWLHIHSLSRGHPLVLELINRGASAGGFHETLERYVNVEIFSKLSAEQKRLLGSLSVYRDAVPLEALTEQGLDVDVLDSLVETGLARQADSDIYDVHDLIREFLLQNLDAQTKSELHQKCVTWYDKQSAEPEVLIEKIYHLTHCDRHELAASIIDESGRELVSRGHVEMLQLLERIEISDLSEELSCKMLQLKGEVLLLLARFTEAENVFNEAMEPAKASSNKHVMADIYSSLADVVIKRGENEEALSLHHKALAIYVELNDAKGASRTYNNIGYLFRRKSDRVKALEAYSDVESILLEHPELLSSRIILARSLLDLDEVERAREHAMTAFEQSQSMDEPLQLARSKAVLGRYYAKVNDLELALHHYSDSLSILSETADKLALVEVSILLGEVLQDGGRKEEALERYREALVIAEANDLRMQIGELLARLGGVAPDRQRRMEYLQRALTVFRELGAQSQMREVQMMVHAAVMGR